MYLSLQMFALQKPSFVNTLIGTGIFAITPLIFVYSQGDTGNSIQLLSSFSYWLFIAYYLGIYFLLELFVMPRFYLKKKLVAFVLTLILLLAVTSLVQPFDRLLHYAGHNGREERFIRDAPGIPLGNESYPLPERKDMGKHRGPVFDIVSMFLLLIILLLVIADYAVRKSRVTEQRALQAEADKANAELSFLKAQINPHFLFNTLNNIYSLAVTKNDHAPDAIMRLSNIMRYITDEGNETMVPLQDEIDCINDYISLQKLRLGENFAIDFSTSGDVIGKKIPPLVLMTFVENAFKHGVSNHNECSIILKILAQNKYIHFFARNKLFEKPRNAERTGVGIENTNKRLKVLYPEKHLLKIEKLNGLYTVELVLYN